MKKAIVTGATGFIGKFLVRELVKQNVEVIAVVRRGTKNLNTINALPVKIVECNIADYHMLPDMIADRDIDVVFHIAWQGVSDLDARNEAIQMQNLQSTLDLIDAMHIMRIGCFIGCGSMHEAESLVEMNEDKVISNLGYMYKATKTAAHWIGKAKCGTYGIRFFWPLINTYGEEERSARLVNTIIRKVLHGESPDLSAGNQYYDFVHVSDVARALNEKNMELLYLSNQDIWYKHRELHHCGAASPCEFLGYIRNASYVVTNSFHATAFSIIFHREFYSEIGLKRNGRIKNILNLTGLQDHAINRGINKENTFKGKIDWSKVDVRLNLEKEKSYKFLRSVVDLIEK